MANKLINSTNIKVFPTAYRNDYDPGAKFYSEENIGNILNSIIDNNSIQNKQGFVVGKPGIINDGSYITFNLHGYWFRMKFNNSDFSNFNNKVIAYIEITPDTTVDTNNKHLKHATLKNLNDVSSDNLDSDGTDPSTSVFGGIKFFDDYQTSENENYQLLIAEKINSVWTVTEKSVLKISTLDILDRASSVSSYESNPVNIRTRFTTETANISTANIDIGNINTGNIDELNVTDEINLANLEISQNTQIGPSQHEDAVSEKFAITSTSYCALGSYNTGNDRSLRNIYVDATTSGAGNEFAYLQDLGSAGFTIDYIESDSTQPNISEYFTGGNGLTATKLFEVKWDSDNDIGNTTVHGTFTIDGSISGNTLFDDDVKVDGELKVRYSNNNYINLVEDLPARLVKTAGRDDTIAFENIYQDLIGSQVKIDNVDKAQTINKFKSITFLPDSTDSDIKVINLTSGSPGSTELKNYFNPGDFYWVEYDAEQANNVFYRISGIFHYAIHNKEGQGLTTFTDFIYLSYSSVYFQVKYTEYGIDSLTVRGPYEPNKPIKLYYKNLTNINI